MLWLISVWCVCFLEFCGRGWLLFVCVRWFGCLCCLLFRLLVWAVGLSCWLVFVRRGCAVGFWLGARLDCFDFGYFCWLVLLWVFYLLCCLWFDLGLIIVGLLLVVCVLVVGLFVLVCFEVLGACVLVWFLMAALCCVDGWLYWFGFCDFYGFLLDVFACNLVWCGLVGFGLVWVILAVLVNLLCLIDWVVYVVLLGLVLFVGFNSGYTFICLILF